MSAYAVAHVEAASRERVEDALREALQALDAATVVASSGPFPGGLLTPLGSTGLPPYLGLANDGSGWTRIALSTFNTAPELFCGLSRILTPSHVVVVVAESVSDSYDLGVYQGGEVLIRRQMLGGEESEAIVTERLREFGPTEEGSFDFDDMERCAQSLGLSLRFDVNACEWRTLQIDWPRRNPAAPKRRKRFWLF